MLSCKPNYIKISDRVHRLVQNKFSAETQSAADSWGKGGVTGVTSHPLLSTDLSSQILSAFTNIYDVSIRVFGHLWKMLHHIMSYSKDCMPYEGECIFFCASPIYTFLKRFVIFEGLSTCNTTLLSTRIALPTFNYIPPFVLVPSREMRGIGTGNRLFWSTPCLMYLWSLYYPIL